MGDAAQNVQLHQRLTEVLSKLTRGVEADLDRHFSVIATKVSDVSHVLEDIQPQLDRLRASLDSVEKTVSSNLEHSVEVKALPHSFLAADMLTVRH